MQRMLIIIIPSITTTLLRLFDDVVESINTNGINELCKRIRVNIECYARMHD